MALTKPRNQSPSHARLSTATRTSSSTKLTSRAMWSGSSPRLTSRNGRRRITSRVCRLPRKVKSLKKRNRQSLMVSHPILKCLPILNQKSSNLQTFKSSQTLSPSLNRARSLKTLSWRSMKTSASHKRKEGLRSTSILKSQSSSMTPIPLSMATRDSLGFS